MPLVSPPDSEVLTYLEEVTTRPREAFLEKPRAVESPPLRGMSTSRNQAEIPKAPHEVVHKLETACGLLCRPPGCLSMEGTSGMRLTSPIAGGQKQLPLSGRRPARRPAADSREFVPFLASEFFDRRRRDFATGGVRADRIGAKPLGESSHEGALARVSTLGGP
jgi:hypothetical protein